MDRSPLSRFILFFAIAMTMMMLWNQFVIGPKLAQQQKIIQQQADKKKANEEEHNLPLVAKRPLKFHKKQENKKAAVLAKNLPKIVKQIRKDVLLGSLDPESGYFLQAKISSRGASVEFIKLNDERYQVLDRSGPLEVVSGEYKEYRTFQTSVEWIDNQLKKRNTSLVEVEWKHEKTEQDAAGNNNSVVYSFTAPDGTIKVTKRFFLRPVTVGESSSNTVRDSYTDGYMLGFDLSFENLGGNPVTLNYVLQGPVGVPLENKKQTRIFRNVRTGFLDKDSGEVISEELAAAEVNKKEHKDEIEIWKAGIKYIGIDVKYFTALIVPREDQIEKPYIEISKAQLLPNKPSKEKFSDISVILESKELILAQGETVEHSYSLYAGPKRKELLNDFLAEGTINFGWFGTISAGMLWILKFIYSFIGNYGIAIILLTVVVRGSMYPLSRKQAKGAKKMKELQPKIQELKKKYGDDREKMARAQMELFSKHGYNPVAGCLPLLLQMPIFFSLFGALNNAVDLRLANFLWVENLASPDALFDFPGGFTVPFLGWSTFNLLPVLTTILFVVQQKMLTPPAVDDQQRMQQKMMMYMSIFFGFMFYSMPAGLCVYFISSSLWGLAERKMVDFQKDKPLPETTTTTTTTEKPKPSKPSKSSKDKDPDKPKGFMARLMAAADEAARAKAQSAENKKQNPDSRATNGQRKKKSGSKKNKRNRR